MLGSSFFELAIGLIFVYVLLSLVCSGLSEVFAQLLNLRAKTLKQGIRQLLNDDDIRKAFYKHPLIKSLSRDTSSEEKSDLTYIPSSNFALALIGNLTAAAQTEDTEESPPADPFDDALQKLQKGVKNLKNEDLQKSLSAFLDTAGQEIEKVQKNVEAWFNSVMSQASEWYRKRAQWILLAVALVVTSAFNADTIDMATTLWHNPTLRESVAEAASAYVAQTTNNAGQPPQSIEAVQQQISELKALETLKLPLGWSTETTPSSFGAWVLKIVGLLFTAFAASQGAPFWFDLLRKLVSKKP